MLHIASNLTLRRRKSGDAACCIGEKRLNEDLQPATHHPGARQESISMPSRSATKTLPSQIKAKATTVNHVQHLNLATQGGNPVLCYEVKRLSSQKGTAETVLGGGNGAERAAPNCGTGEILRPVAMVASLIRNLDISARINPTLIGRNLRSGAPFPELPYALVLTGWTIL